MKIDFVVGHRTIEAAAVAAAMVLVVGATLACKGKGDAGDGGGAVASPSASVAAAAPAPAGGGGDTCDIGDNGVCIEFDAKGGTNEKTCTEDLGGKLNKVPSCPKELRFGTCRVATPAMNLFMLAEDGQGGWESATYECDKHKGTLTPTPTKEILSTWTTKEIDVGPLKGYAMLVPPHTKFEDAAGVQAANQYAGYFMMQIWKEKLDAAAARKDAMADKDFSGWITNTDTKLVWKVKSTKSFLFKAMTAVNVGGTDFRCETDMAYNTEELANANVEACLSLAKK